MAVERNELDEHVFLRAVTGEGKDVTSLPRTVAGGAVSALRAGIAQRRPLALAGVDQERGQGICVPYCPRMCSAVLTYVPHVVV